MLDFLKKHNKKSIDIYDFLFGCYHKHLSNCSSEEINEFLKELQDLESQKIIVLTKSEKGEGRLGWINRNILINKGNLTDKIVYIDDEIFIKEFGMDSTYYLKRNEEYHLHKSYIEKLGSFLLNNKGELTLNEIGYLVFHDEKALTQPEKSAINGIKILGNLKMNLSSIAYTETIFPFYFPVNKKGDTVLIVENKDTCFSLFRLLNATDTNIKGVLYGQGRAIAKIFSFLDIYGLNDEDRYLYYGDIDQEGFDIFRALRERYPKFNIKLSQVLYHHLLKHGSLPLRSKRNLDNIAIVNALTDLSPVDKNEIASILESDRYIPQEALNYIQIRVIINGLQNRLY